MNKDSGPQYLVDRATRYLVVAYQAIAVFALIAIPFWAFQYFHQPFIGVFLEHTLVSNGVGPDDPAPEWNLYNAFQTNQPGHGFGNQLVSLAVLDANGNPLQTIEPTRFSQITTLLKGHAAGEMIQTTFRDQQGKTAQYKTSLNLFPFSDQIRYFYLPYAIGLIYLLVSLWIFGLRRSETAGRAFSILASSVAIVAGGLLDIYTSNHLVYLWIAAIAMVGASLIHLGLVFPQEARIVSRFPFLRWVCYLIALGLTMVQYTTLFDFSRPTLYANTWKFSYIFAGIGVFFFLGTMIYRHFWSPSPVVRQQAFTILIGAILGFGYITAWLMLTSVLIMNFNPYLGFLPLAIFPATTGYTVLRQRLLRTEYLMGRGVVYALMTIMALGGYILLALGPSLLFGIAVGPDNPLLIAATVILTAFILNFARGWLQSRIDRMFFRGESAHQDRLKIFTRELTSAVSFNDILRILREQITVSLLPSQLHIYVYDPLSDQYIATADETGKITSDIHFSASSPLPAAMSREKLPVFVDEDRVPESIRAERGRLVLLGSQLFIPMPGRERLVGWLGLGERLSGETYASHDISFLEALSNQSAMALERAQVVTNMERRVREMNNKSGMENSVIIINIPTT